MCSLVGICGMVFLHGFWRFLGIKKPQGLVPMRLGFEICFDLCNLLHVVGLNLFVCEDGCIAA
jgi:hypothetical protein